MNRFLTLLAMAIFIAACTGSPESGLIGIWDDLDEDVTVSFYQGGELVIDNDGVKTRGRYEVLDDGRLLLTLINEEGQDSASIAVRYDLNGGRLILTNPDGEKTTMVRLDP